MSQTSIEIYNTVTDVQIIEVTAGGLTTTADLNAAVTSASGSATAAAASAASASSAASSATASASSATTSAASAATSASSATASASTATTQANVATTAASEAEASAVSALDSSNAAAASETAAASSASSAASSAATATTQATTATTQAGIASTAATTATEQATIATTGANTATTQAGIATTAATAASASASQAASSAAQAAAVTLQQSFGRKFVPTISLDATSRTVPSYLPCTRAGVATFFDQSGVLRTAANNEGRIDFDPVTGECLGLLDEGEVIAYGRGFDNFSTTYWGSLIIGTGVNPQRFLKTVPDRFGRPNMADRIICDRGASNTTSDQSQIFQTFNIVTGINYTMRFWARSTTEGTNNVIRVRNMTGDTNITLTTTWTLYTFSGVISNASQAPTFGVRGTFTPQIADFQISEFEFVRTENYVRPVPNYTAGTLTRPADLFATTGFQFARRYNQREGTFYINTRAISDLTTTVAVFSDGSTNNETRLLANGTLTIRKGGVQIATIQATGATLNAHSIFGFTYKGTRIVITRNGATVGVVTASEELATNYTQFQLGTGIYVRNLRYVPRAFSDSELQFVTNPLYFVGLEGDKVPTINDLSSGAFMEVQDLQTLRTRSEITIFGSGVLRSIVINRPYPFLIEQVYVSPTGVTTATLPTLPAAGFYAANTDYTVLFNATADRTLVLAIIPQTIN